MFPHPLIVLKLARTRHDQLVARAQPRALRRQRGAPAPEHRPGASEASHFAHREAGGVTVDLYWAHRRFVDSFRFDVVDRRRRTGFTLRPATGKEAVEAYHHPFAAAVRAARGAARPLEGEAA
jgi:hypothetical protein